FLDLDEARRRDDCQRSSSARSGGACTDGRLGKVDPAVDLVGPHSEAVERVQSERGADGYVGGVAPTCDEYAANARSVVAGIEHVPLTTEKGLEPARKVHRTWLGRDADIAQVAGSI